MQMGTQTRRGHAPGSRSHRGSAHPTPQRPWVGTTLSPTHGPPWRASTQAPCCSLPTAWGPMSACRRPCPGSPHSKLGDALPLLCSLSRSSPWYRDSPLPGIPPSPGRAGLTGVLTSGPSVPLVGNSGPRVQSRLSGRPGEAVGGYRGGCALGLTGQGAPVSVGGGQGMGTPVPQKLHPGEGGARALHLQTPSPSGQGQRHSPV